MFKHGHLEKQLREDGRAATAEIVSIKTEGEGSSWRSAFSDDSDMTTTWFDVRLKLRVRPDGEPSFDATIHTRLNTIKSDGDTVPILYDPDDHGKVVVDYEADARAKMDAMKRVVPEQSAADRRHADLGELELLGTLHERGVLTDAELEAEKARILKDG